ncbi:Rne/Rng family ribonuclease [Naumannella huperziae]
MLDEPTNNSDNGSGEDARPQRRRRRAASRPAGPPVAVPENPSTPEQATPEQATPEVVGDGPIPAEAELTDQTPVDAEIVDEPATDASVGPTEITAAPAEQQPAAEAVEEPGEAVATGADEAEDVQPAGGGSTRLNRVLLDPFAPPQVVAAPARPESDRVGESDEDADEPDDDSDDSDSDDSDNDDSDNDDSDNDDSDESGDGRPRRRRRRRGGRRRRRGGDDSDESDDQQSAGSDDAEGGEGDGKAGESAKDGKGDSGAKSDDDADDEDEGQSSGRRRRRRRRRRGEDASSADDDPSDVVVKVRDGRRGKASDEVTGIDGSTRMEAKRQRRREGRSAGRRRAPILSEAEFLARRESVDRKMVIRQNDELAQIGVLEDGVLVEHYVDRASAASLIGNVYLGRVQNVLPSMEAAFIDIGRGRNAVLYAGEIDWNAFGVEGDARKVENVLKSGQTVLVQVTKDPVGAKGARLTGHVSLPGRYIVYAPGGHLSGISRKLPDNERKRLKEILAELVDDDASVIVRTAAEGATEDELVRDVTRLKAQWEAINKQVKSGSGAPKLLYGEPDLTVRIVRDLFTEDFSELTIDGNDSTNDAYETVTAYVGHVAPHLADRIKRWDREQGDIFAASRVDEQIAKALERKVFLPSGGSLIIDRTEAMTVIDVNTGKFTGSGGNLEATVTSNNLEAAEEIVRQLRLRDIGGIIVIDFIDMVLPSNRELLLRRLVECLGRDRTRHQVAEVTSLGLVQMTRKKIGTGLAEAFTETCECCSGRGYEIHDMPVETQAPSDGGERKGRGGRRGGKDRSSAKGRKNRDKAGDDSGKSDSGKSDSGKNDSGKNDSGKNDSGKGASEPAGNDAAGSGATESPGPQQSDG